MRDLSHLNPYRVPLNGDLGDGQNGAFLLKVKGEEYMVIASSGFGWEHVSISHKHKIPSWTVMCILKDLFFEEDEVVMQVHPAKRDYVNNHPNCLHLWRPLKVEIPLPPREFV